ncbi:spore protease YyaC [Lutibacter sp. B2]|nr:spore protease YyaC [Lutibacter sp. B2]
MNYPKSTLLTRTHHTKENATEILSQSIRDKITPRSLVLCIGTDRCIGDALGPIVGTLLKEKNCRFPVYGTLDSPIHAVNLLTSIEAIKETHPNRHILAVDACLGYEHLIGNIHVKKGPIFPGKGVGKNLPGVGQTSIIGIVDKFHGEDCFSIHTIRLNLVTNIAKIIVNSIIRASYLS